MVLSCFAALLLLYVKPRRPCHPLVHRWWAAVLIAKNVLVSGCFFFFGSPSTTSCLVLFVHPKLCKRNVVEGQLVRELFHRYRAARVERGSTR